MKSIFAILILLAATVPSGAEPFATRLAGKLVKLDPTSGELRPYEISAAAAPEYFLIYFSAHWCGPCRRRTPALVEFYKETKASHPGFELILVSADHDVDGMKRYIDWAQMPWPALAWDARDSVPEITDLAPRAIPFMALLDRNGSLVLASDLGGYNIGIPKVLNQLQASLGSEVYDVEERHGKKSPAILILYGLGGAILLFMAVRRIRRGSDA